MFTKYESVNWNILNLYKILLFLCTQVSWHFMILFYYISRCLFFYIYIYIFFLWLPITSEKNSISDTQSTNLLEFGFECMNEFGEDSSYWALIALVIISCKYYIYIVWQYVLLSEFLDRNELQLHFIHLFLSWREVKVNWG